MAWWKRSSAYGDLLDNEAAQFIEAHGARAVEVARAAARSARNKLNLKRARHYTHVARRIAELTKSKIAPDAATPVVEQQEASSPSQG